MRYRIPLLAIALAALATGARAQDDDRPAAWKPELRPFIGTSIPTGAQRDAIASDILFGLQMAAELRPTFHLVGTFGWNLARTKLAVLHDDVQVLQ